jgi:hypothetical protein
MEFYVYTRWSASFIPPDSPSGFRDLTSVLDSRISGMPVPAPSQASRNSETPRVLQLRPNTFFGGGILPWNLRDVFAIAPCIYSPTGWMRRQLSNKEMFDVLDIPENLHRELTVSQANTLIQDTTFIPLKVLLRLDSLTLEDWGDISTTLKPLNMKEGIGVGKLTLSKVVPQELNDISIATQENKDPHIAKH